jgi:hypothetical protein
MSAYAPNPDLVLAMLANRIPLTLLPDLAWLTETATTDFTRAGNPANLSDARR